jgi:hypothetical protein
MEGEGLARLREEIEEVAGTLRAQAAEVHELAKSIERLTQDTPPPGMPARGPEWR